MFIKFSNFIQTGKQTIKLIPQLRCPNNEAIWAIFSATASTANMTNIFEGKALETVILTDVTKNGDL